MGVERLRKYGRQITGHALEAVNPATAIKNALLRDCNSLVVKKCGRQERVFDLGRFNRIFVVGAGKATSTMAKALEDILSDRLTEGIIIVKYGYTQRLRRIKVIEGAHPIPDGEGANGAREVVRLLHGADEKTLVICLISGGGSALLPLPAGDIKLIDKIKVTKLLLECGADIVEINSVRKHLSLIKGGQLARAAYPATVCSLIISDVIGDRLDTIASGPTVPDETTFEDASRVFDKYNLWHKIPNTVSDRVKSGLSGRIDDTPKSGDMTFDKVYNYIIASNIQALMAARTKAKSLGFNAFILSSTVQGETREIARMHASIAREIRTTGNPLHPPACVISGGETTVTVRGRGKGGRNQEFALAAAVDIDGLKDTVILSVGSDGIDGPTDAAGGMVDGGSLKRAKRLGLAPLEYLDNNDSYNFLKKIDSLIITGPTNTNVMDIRLILVG